MREFIFRNEKFCGAAQRVLSASRNAAQAQEKRPRACGRRIGRTKENRGRSRGCSLAEEGPQSTRIAAACGPFWPCLTSNSTRWFSASDLKPVPWISLKCANRSLPPASGVMKPKPLPSSNHLTMPVWVLMDVSLSFGDVNSTGERPRSRDTQESNPGVFDLADPARGGVERER